MRATYGAYAAQGLAYALLVSALPSFQDTHHLSATAISLILLGICALAAGGSLLGAPLARRLSSSAALGLGLLAEAVGLAGAALAPSAPLFLVSLACYGVGLGLVDAGSVMRAIALQRAHGRALLSGFFATYTAAALSGAILTAIGLRLVGASFALVLGSLVAAVIALACWRAPALPEAIEVEAEDGASASVSPAAPRVVVAGLVVLVAFLVDSAISSWSAIRLSDLGLGASAPLGYGLYQLVVLAVRLGGNRILARVSAARLGLGVLVIAATGCALVATANLVLVFLGLGLAALAVALLVPMAFGAVTAGRADSDAIVAQVNTYNYAGAVLGAVSLGALSELDGLGLAFLLPAVVLVASIPLVRSMTSRPTVSR